MKKVKKLSSLIAMAVLAGNVACVDTAWAGDTVTFGGTHDAKYSSSDQAGVDGTGTEGLKIGDNVEYIQTVTDGVSLTSADAAGIFIKGVEGFEATSISGGISVKANNDTASERHLSAINVEAYNPGIGASAAGATISGLGSLYCDTQGSGAVAHGIRNKSVDPNSKFTSDITFANSDSSITAISATGKTRGIGAYGYGTGIVRNLGNIVVKSEGAYRADGIYTEGLNDSFSLTVDFSGASSKITATATGSSNKAGGIYLTQYGKSTITGLGSIEAVANGEAAGIRFNGYSEGFNSSVAFTGAGSKISAASKNNDAYGIYVCNGGVNSGKSEVKDLGNIEVETNGSGSAVGIYFENPDEHPDYSGTTDITFADSDSSITAKSSTGRAAGIGISGWRGTATVKKLGSIVVQSGGTDRISGIHIEGTDESSLTVDFSGTSSKITATATGSSNKASGIYLTKYGKSTITGLGTIEAAANDEATGIRFNGYSEGFSSSVAFTGAGSKISATSKNNDAYGIYVCHGGANSGTSEVKDLGSIEVKSEGSGSAVGIYLENPDDYPDYAGTTNISFKGNGSEAIKATADNAYSIADVSTSANTTTNISFEDSVLSGKIHHTTNSTLNLNFNSGGIWRPATGDVTGTVNVNLNEGGTLDLLEGVDLTSGNVNITNGGTVKLGGTTKLSSISGSGTVNVFGLNNTVSGDFSAKEMNCYITPTDMNAAGSNTMLNVGGTASIDNATVKAGVYNVGTVAAGNKITLVKAGTLKADGITTGTLTDGLMKVDLDIAKSGNTITATVKGGSDPVKPGEEAKSPVETQAAAVSLVNSGADMMAGEAMQSASAVVASEQAAGNATVMSPFASTGGSNMRLNSGSHVDTKSWNIAVGFAKEVENANGKLMFGPVIEYGKGSYDSYLDNGTHGDGTSSFFGIGFMVKQEYKSNLYVEGSIRGGRSENDYSAVINGTDNSYDNSSTYLGAHLGVGKVVPIGEKDDIDYYCKLFYTYQAGSDATLKSGHRYDFDAVNSFRTKLGFRYNHKLNPVSTLYAGLAWQHEFGSECNATVHTGDYSASAPSPSVKGDSGILELGCKFKTGTRLETGIGLLGSVGKQRGIGGHLEFKWIF